MRAAAQAERAVHCEGVRPGKARVFNCLLAAAGYADFSGACREHLARGQLRRVKDWRLDYDLRQACKEDVPKARGTLLCEGPEGPEGLALSPEGLALSTKRVCLCCMLA